VTEIRAVIQARYDAFGAFLRSRRERLTPAMAGLPPGVRRRTPGLRRDEVALLAGVGTTWYTWLEQGRDVRASPEVLSALAAALRLDPTERAYLFMLGGQPMPELPPSGPEQVEPPLQRMLTSLSGQPAYVLGRRWDILAWNRAAAILFGDYARLAGDERNIMHMLFADPEHRRLLVDWEILAPASLAMFRADSAKYAGDTDFERLIAILNRESPEFRAWWPRHDVLSRLATQKRVNHPAAGLMVFEYTSFAVTGRPGMKLIVYTPLDEHGSGEKLGALLRRGLADRDPDNQTQRIREGRVVAA